MIPYYQIQTIPLGPIQIQTYGLLVGLGFVLALILAIREGRRHNISENTVMIMGVLVFVGAIISARALFVLSNWDLFSGNLVSVFYLWQGGMAISGGMLGGIAAGVAYLKYKKQRIAIMADIVAVVFPAGLALGRFGCNAIKDHMGSITTVPWGVEFMGQIRHDTTMYSILTGIVLFSIFWPIRKKFSKPGLLAAWVIGSYAVLRFINDFFRATDLPGSDPRYYGLTIAQYAMIGFFSVSLGFLLAHYTKVLSRAKKKPTED